MAWLKHPGIKVVFVAPLELAEYARHACCRRDRGGKPDTFDHEALADLRPPCRINGYDAVYLELGLRRNLPLATLDDELIKARKEPV
jgi:hypothetical protein